MISSVGWVRSGVARAKPIEADDDDDEPLEAERAEAVAAAARAAAALNAHAASGDADADRVARRFALDEYDEDEDPHDAGALPMFSRRTLMFHRTNDDDPYVTLKDADDDDSDADDLEIKPTDKLVLAARSEEDVSNIEVHVYEEEGHNLYPHHDIMLPSFPLALEWLGTRPAAAGVQAPTRGNLVAVGTFEPQIEIWDLDVLSTFAPVAVLGDAYTEPVAPPLGKKKAGKKNDDARRAPRPERAGGAPDPTRGHTDAVMGLAWNVLQPNALASASADRTVRIWDLGTPALACVQTLSHHTDKVQSVRWHQTEPSVLLTGSFDKTAAVVDVRAQSAFRSLALGADVEALAWASDTHVLAATEDGHVSCYDVRTSARVWTLAAHDSAATGLSTCATAAGVFATCSTDKLVKVWKASADRPQLLVSRDLQLGALYDVAFCPDAPYLLSAGGGNGKVGVWDASDSPAVCDALGVASKQTPTGGSVVASGMQALDVNSSDSDGEDEQSAPSAPPAARPKAAGPAVARKQPVKAKVKAAAGGGGSKKGGSKKS